MATRPRFLLTGKVPLVLQRRTLGEYVRGKWVEATPVEVEVRANVQPLRFSQIMHMPEADRTKEWLVVYSAERILERLEGECGHDADRFEWEGNLYQVYRARPFSMGVLDHWEVYAVRVERT